MDETKQPAEAFPVGHYIEEELEARGWSVADLAARMGGKFDVNCFAVELLIACSDDPRMMMDDETAGKLARGFGTSPELWLNLARTYRTWRAGTN